MTETTRAATATTSLGGKPTDRETAAAWAERMLADAPPLSPETRDRLAELLRPVRRPGKRAEGGAA